MTIEEKFRAVPRRIQDWFWSDEMDAIILDIEKKFALPADETILPSYLFYVEIGDLPYEILEDELIDALKLSPNVGHDLFMEIQKRVFLPLAHDFIAFGIGVEELTEALGTSTPTAPLPQPQTLPTPMPAQVASTPVAPISSFSIPTTTTTAPSAPAPTPVSLYRDTFASQTPVSSPRLGVMSTGDISRSVTSTPQSQRLAHIDLGAPVVSTGRQDDEFKSLFIERETPLPQKVDYGAPVVSAISEPSSPTAPVPLSAAPSFIPDAPAYIPPSIEVTSQTPTAQSQGDAPEAGFFSSIMHRIAPWHAVKFSRTHVGASNAPLPTTTVNYDAAPPDASMAAPMPSATPTPIAAVPLPDVSTPQPPQA